MQSVSIDPVGAESYAVPPVGFEPTTNGLKVHCANQTAPQGRDEAIGQSLGRRPWALDIAQEVFGRGSRRSTSSGNMSVMLLRTTLPSARRNGLRMAMLAGFGLAALSACAEIGQPELGADPVTSVTTSVGTDQGATPAEEATVPLSPLIRDFAPPRPEGYVPSVLGGTPSGLFVLDDGLGITELLAPVGDTIATKLVDDFYGGIVVQEASGDIRWFGAQGGEPLVVDSTGGQLLDVGFLDATSAIHALILVGRDQVDTYSLTTGERVPFLRLEEGSSLLDMSASNGLHAVVLSDQNCGDLVFFNSSGELVDLGGPGRPACVVARRPAYGAVALGPDRSSVVYTEQSYRSDGVVSLTRIVAEDLASQAELFNLSIGGAGQKISQLSFDGQRLVYLREDPEGSTVEILDPFGEEPAQVIDVTDPLSVTFARQRLSVGRDTLSQ